MHNGKCIHTAVLHLQTISSFMLFFSVCCVRVRSAKSRSLASKHPLLQNESNQLPANLHLNLIFDLTTASPPLVAS